MPLLGIHPLKIINQSPEEFRYFNSFQMEKMTEPKKKRLKLKNAAFKFALFVIFFAVLGNYSSVIAGNTIRKPAVSGSFYPPDKETLKGLIQAYLKNSSEQKLKGVPRIIIAPHAGYPYSGQVAAYAYKALLGQNIKTVILMSDSHTEYFEGVSIYEEGAFETPLGGG